MDRKANSCRGQAVVEFTLTATTLVLVATLVAGTAMSLRGRFKHQNITNPLVPSSSQSPESHQESGTLSASTGQDTLTLDADLPNEFKGHLVMGRDKDGKISISQLELEGWAKKDNLELDGKVLMTFEKDNQELVTDGKIGVISCSSDCAQ